MQIKDLTALIWHWGPREVNRRSSVIEPGNKELIAIWFMQGKEKIKSDSSKGMWALRVFILFVIPVLWSVLIIAALKSSWISYYAKCSGTSPPKLYITQIYHVGLGFDTKQSELLHQGSLYLQSTGQSAMVVKWTTTNQCKSVCISA